MTIVNLSKENGRATITLDANELVKLCNVLYKAPEDQKNNIYYSLYAAMAIARDLTQYGHLDSWCIEKVVELRSHLK